MARAFVMEEYGKPGKDNGVCKYLTCFYTGITLGVLVHS
jgi:hypothetical protein